jgi:hypothetical protein
MTDKHNNKATTESKAKDADFLSNILNLTDIVANIYLKFLKYESASVDEFIEKEKIHDDKEDVKIYLDVLTKQEYLDKVKINNEIIYKPRSVQKQKNRLPEEIWDKILGSDN